MLLRLLAACQAMDNAPRILVEIEVVSVKRVVGRTQRRIRLDASPRPQPLGDLVAAQPADRATGEKRIAVACSEGDVRHLLTLPGNGRNEVQPGVGLRAAADRYGPAHACTDLP